MISAVPDQHLQLPGAVVKPAVLPQLSGAHASPLIRRPWLAEPTTHTNLG